LLANELASTEKYQSIPFNITLYVYDVNDNPPIFDKETYHIGLDLDAISSSSGDLEILQFNVTDRDSGVYGIMGLACKLSGYGSEM
jgi:hypothetical protein